MNYKSDTTIKMSLKKISSLLAMLFVAVSIWAVELPVKTLNGKEYFCYSVKHGDTLYSLMNKLGLSRRQIIESNPSAADMMRAGDVLYFPVKEYNDKFERQVTTDEQVSDAIADGDNHYVTHQVKKGETLYGIANKYKVDQEEIAALNPTIKYSGVKAGMTIKIPVEAVQARVAEDEVKPLGQPSLELTPVSPAIKIAPAEESVNIVQSPTAISTNGPASIAVMLPFMLDNENVTRQAQLYTDFYKGLMIAADTLSSRGDSVRIFAYDTKGDIAELKRLLEQDNIKNASVIIAPDSEDQIAAINAAELGSRTMALNVFNVKDSSYISSPHMIQTNIPHRLMYEKASDAIERYYSDYIPVILRNEGGKNDKAEFVAYLKARYEARGIEPIEINYDGALMSSHLEPLVDNGCRYLIIPTSGALSEFNKFSHVIKSAKDADYDAERIAVFGYPDWTAFRGDAEAMLHSLNATIYSRFYYNERGFEARSLNSAFNRWYGENMMEVVPNQAALGFDVGNMLIRNIRANNGYFNPDAQGYTGLQSSFGFDRQGDGYINTEIYILRFLPTGSVIRL